jgi:hypothetical protein
VTASEDEILVAELGALAVRSGARSGFLTKAVAKRLRTRAHEVELVVPLAQQAAVTRVRRVLRGGRRVPDDEGVTVRTVLGGGYGGLNPVVVTARVTTLEPEVSRIELRAAAKEGLIRQRTAERTATRLAAQLA